MSEKITDARSFFKNLPSIVWPILLLAIMIIINLIFTDGFAVIEWRDGRWFGSIFDILKRGAPTMILAIGMTLVIGTGGIDISVGSIIAIAGAVVVYEIRGGDISYGSKIAEQVVYPSLVKVIGLGLIAGLICGAFNGILIAIFKMQPIIATLILMVAGRGVALMITDGYQLRYKCPTFDFIGLGFIGGIGFPIIVVIGLFILISLFIKYTPLSLYIKSVGANRTASQYTGVNTIAVLMLVYMISGVCASVAGMLLVADIRSVDPTKIGELLELDAILAVVIGGTSMAGGRFSIIGSIVGVLIVQTMTTTILTNNIPTEYTLLFKSAIILIVLLLQSGNFRSLVGKLFGGSRSGKKMVPGTNK